MKVKKTIRIRKENIRELKKLECVESIEQNGRDILVHLNPEYTEGKTYRPQQETSQRRIRRDIPKGYQGEEG